MFRKKNVITFYANEMYDGNLETIYPSYKHFPEWYGKSKKTSKCPFTSFFSDSEYKPKINQTESLDINKLIQDFHKNEQKKILESNKLISNPQVLTRDTTVVNCPGITDYLKTGYIVPSWSDISFRKLDGKIMFNSCDLYPDVHHGIHIFDQYRGMNNDQLPFSGGFHKVSTPWMMKTTPGTSVLITHPFWDRNKSFTTVSAVVHPDKTPVQIKWFFEFNKEMPNTPDIVDVDQQIIERGTPLILLVPFKRDRFYHEFKYLSSTEMEKIYRDATSKTLSWISETLYNKFRKQIGNLYK
jgi:hypothetical protein